jgi:hypothetical protein
MPRSLKRTRIELLLRPILYNIVNGSSKVREQDLIYVETTYKNATVAVKMDICLLVQMTFVKALLHIESVSKLALRQRRLQMVAVLVNRMLPTDVARGVAEFVGDHIEYTDARVVQDGAMKRDSIVGRFMLLPLPVRGPTAANESIRLPLARRHPLGDLALAPRRWAA